MSLRRATEADRDTLVGLWDEWVAGGETAVPPWVEDAREGTAEGIDRAIREGSAVVWEEDGEAIGFACGVMVSSRTAELTEIYVRPPARRRGIARELVGAVVGELKALGAEFVTGGVAPDNGGARAFYEHAGFRPEAIRLIADVQTLERRLAEKPRGRSFGSIHVQSDDVPAVERAVRQFVPRLPGRSRGSVVGPPRGGWIAVYDELCDRDPKQLRRLAQELSDRFGAAVIAFGVEEDAVARFVLLDRGRIVDEYASVPEYFAELPSGIVVSLAANPTVVSRLTGADPTAVRAAAPQAASPDELPAPADIVARLAEVMGIEGVGHGYPEARALADAIVLDRDN
jgi:ribosomal protein S18 acetylase RimI-like enzyme